MHWNGCSYVAEYSKDCCSHVLLYVWLFRLRCTDCSVWTAQSAEQLEANAVSGLQTDFDSLCVRYPM